MADVTVLANALGTALGTAGIRALPYLTDTFSPPVALVAIDQVEYHQAFGAPANGMASFHFLAQVILARSSDRAALTAMEGYLSTSGSTSVLDALEADPSLGGVAQALVVTRSRPPAAISINGAEYITVPFEVTVYA
jgi:hypothetical protein